MSEVCNPGSPLPKLLAPEADLRTDLNLYRVYEYGKIVDEPRDITKYWNGDMVAFVLPCSFSFEGVLRQHNVSFRDMGAYTTNLRANPAGRFTCDNMIATVRLFKSNRDAIRAIQITSRLPVSHGAPICIGDPESIGIDMYKPDIWNPYPDGTLPQAPNEVPLAWICAYTPENAIKNAKPPIAIVQHPGYPFVSDHHTEEFAYTMEIGSNYLESTGCQGSCRNQDGFEDGKYFAGIVSDIRYHI